MGSGDTHIQTETRDASNRDGWSAWAYGHHKDELQARVRLLYHSDLNRVGALSMPGAVGPRWITFGRNVPPFGGLGGATLPLADPHVSREQLRIRFLADRRRFEVEPAPGARRQLGLVDLDHAGSDTPVMTPITGPTIVDPGAVVAIGDRVLLGLELSRVHAPDDDRMGLVGESEPMWALRDEIRSVARFGGSALVIGPTGAGKELVARAIHQASPRAAGPFVAVNCAALPETLVEAVLFGHKKGAFTGADAEGKGLFRAAEGGTLFLDELGELPIAVQPKLLRVLQDGVVVPVGAHEGRHIDVRVVAATHRDLDAQVRDGGLREDLYHRMSAHVLHVPSLSARRMDVPELVVHMLRRHVDEHRELAWLWDSGRTWKPGMPIGFMADLIRRAWSGNVRELQNYVERTARMNLQPGAFQAPDAPAASALTTGEVAPVSADAPTTTPPPAGGDAAASAPVPDALLRAASETLGLAQKTVLKLLPAEALAALAAEVDGAKDQVRAKKLRAAAAEALLRLLEAHDFNQSGVAATLGTSRTTLIKLMDDLGLPRATDSDGRRDRARARQGRRGPRRHREAPPRLPERAEEAPHAPEPEGPGLSAAPQVSTKRNPNRARSEPPFTAARGGSGGRRSARRRVVEAAAPASSASRLRRDAPGAVRIAFADAPATYGVAYSYSDGSGSTRYASSGAVPTSTLPSQTSVPSGFTSSTTPMKLNATSVLPLESRVALPRTDVKMGGLWRYSQTSVAVPAFVSIAYSAARLSGGVCRTPLSIIRRLPFGKRCASCWPVKDVSGSLSTFIVDCLPPICQSTSPVPASTFTTASRLRSDTM